MTPDLDSDGHHIGPSTWMRWRLIWRVHYGRPAALALLLWAVSVPMAVVGVDRYTAHRAALSDHGTGSATAASGGSHDQAGTPASAATSTSSAAASAMQASTALAAALAAGDAQLIKALPSTAQRGADLGALISAARNAGLVPSQADYALETGTILGLARLRVDLPVRGSDAQLTRFMAMLDAQLPNGVVESLVVAPAGPRHSSRITANLHLVLFYRAPA
jgi:hypothetical protein